MNRERFTDIICTMVQLNSKISPHTVASSSAIDTANHPEIVELLKQSNTESKDECKWFKEDPDSEEEEYTTGCNKNFIIIDGTPSDIGMKYCCYCGKSIKEQS